MFGESSNNSQSYGYDWDDVTVLNDIGTNTRGADLIEMYWNGSTTSVRVLNRSSISSANSYANAGSNSFGFLLTRGGDAVAAAVPEPDSLALAGLAVLAVAATRRQRALVTNLTR